MNIREKVAKQIQECRTDECSFKHPCPEGKLLLACEVCYTDSIIKDFKEEVEGIENPYQIGYPPIVEANKIAFEKFRQLILAKLEEK